MIVFRASCKVPLKVWRVAIGSDGASSKPVAVDGDVDAVQTGFQAIAVGSKIYLVGGFDANHIGEHIAVFELQLSDDCLSARISRFASDTAQSPSPRRDFTLASSGNTLFVFGGRAAVPGHGAVRFRDSDGLYRLDLTTHSWQLCTGACIEGVDEEEMVPGPRAGCLSVQTAAELWLLGGHRVDTVTSESFNLRSQVFRLDLQTLCWTRVHNKGRTPDPRNLYDAAAVLWAGAIYVIGPRQCHKLDLQASEWSLLPGTLSTHGRALPPGRWLRLPCSESHGATFFGVVEAPQLQEGEPRPRDEGLLSWQLYRLQLPAAHPPAMSACSAALLYTLEQQPDAERLAEARARQEKSFESWGAALGRLAEQSSEREVPVEMKTLLRKQLPVKLMSFGEHKGQLLWELPRSYVEWMGNQPAFFNNHRALLYSLKQLRMLSHYTDETGHRINIRDLGSMGSLDLRMDKRTASGADLARTVSEILLEA